MKRFTVFCLCLLLMAGCSAKPAVTGAPPDQGNTSTAQPEPPTNTADNLEAEVDYDWWRWGLSYIRDDGMYTLSLERQFDGNFEELWIFLSDASGNGVETVIIAPTAAELTENGLLYNVYNDGNFNLLYSFAEDTLSIIDHRNTEQNYSGTYRPGSARDELRFPSTPYSLGQPLYPWYEQGAFCCQGIDAILLLIVNPDSGRMEFNVNRELRAIFQTDDVECFADDEYGGYSYRYVYRANENPNGAFISFLYNTKMDAVFVTDTFASSFNATGVYDYKLQESWCAWGKTYQREDDGYTLTGASDTGRILQFNDEAGGRYIRFEYLLTVDSPEADYVIYQEINGAMIVVAYDSGNILIEDYRGKELDYSGYYYRIK